MLEMINKMTYCIEIGRRTKAVVSAKLLESFMSGILTQPGRRRPLPVVIQGNDERAAHLA